VPQQQQVPLQQVQPSQQRRGPENVQQRIPQQQERGGYQQNRGGYQQNRGGYPQRSQQQAQSWQQQRGWLHGGGWQGGHENWRDNRAHVWRNEHRTWVQRGGYGGFFIPQDRFSLYFGSSHFFRIHTRPSLYLGYPSFQYGGYSFLLLDPWPEDWSDNWYDSDDLYIDYDDGYYLFNRRYPGEALAITIVT